MSQKRRSDETARAAMALVAGVDFLLIGLRILRSCDLATLSDDGTFPVDSGGSDDRGENNIAA